MKKLVVSLLRKGDFVMTSGVLSEIRRNSPDSQIDVLINSDAKPLLELMPYVDNAHLFERDLIQSSLGEIDRNIFEGYDRIEELLLSLNTEGYDEVINLTHTRLSAWLCSNIAAKEYRGLHLNSQGFAGFGSSWFSYLNNYGHFSQSEGFHFSDIYFNGSGQKLQGDRRYRLIETEHGQRNALQYIDPSKKNIVIQCFTSDSKKNWGLENISSYVDYLVNLHGDINFILLASPDEESQLKKLNQKTLKHCQIAVCDLETALSVVQVSQLLITPDTLIKHLAVSTDTPVIELSLGSSQFAKTGIYKSDQFIVQSKIDCAPCGHRTDCSFESNICRNKIEPECIALLTLKILEGHISDIQVIVEEYKDVVDVHRTAFSPTGEWYTYNFIEQPSDIRFQEILDRSTWRLYLNKASGEEILPVGTEVECLIDTLHLIFGSKTSVYWTSILSRIKKRIFEMSDRVQFLDKKFKNVIGIKDDDSDRLNFLKELKDLKNTMCGSRILKTYGFGLEDLIDEIDMNDFVGMRKIHESLRQIKARVEIEIKLIDTIRMNITEVI